MTIELTAAEVALLRSVLEEKLLALHHEIHHTDHREFREGLKADRERLEAILARIGVPAGVTP